MGRLSHSYSPRCPHSLAGCAGTVNDQHVTVVCKQNSSNLSSYLQRRSKYTLSNEISHTKSLFEQDTSFFFSQIKASSLHL